MLFELSQVDYDSLILRILHTASAAKPRFAAPVPSGAPVEPIAPEKVQVNVALGSRIIAFSSNTVWLIRSIECEDEAFRSANAIAGENPVQALNLLHWILRAVGRRSTLW